MKALALEQDNRYQSVQGLQTDIERYQGGFATAAEDAGLGRQLQLLIKRHKGFVAAAALVALSLTVGLGVALAQWRKAVSARTVAEASEQRATENEQIAQAEKEKAKVSEKRAVAAKEEAEYEKYRAFIGLAATKLDKSNAWGARGLLKACPKRYRHWEWGYLAGQCRKIEEMTIHTDNQIVRLSVSPDGKLLACCDFGRKLTIRDVASGKITASLDLGLRAYKQPAFLPDSTRVVVVCGGAKGTLQLFDVRARKRLWSRPLPACGRARVAVTPDGRYAVVSKYTGNEPVEIRDLETGEVVARLPVENSGWATAVACSPDGSRVLVGCMNGDCLLYDLEKRRHTATFKGHRQCVFGISFFPDGKSVATASWDHTVRVWDVATGRCRLTLGGHRGKVEAVLVTNNGKSILSGDYDGYLRVWDARTGELKAVLEGPIIHSLAQTPNAKTLFAGSFDKPTLRRIDLASLLQDRVMNCVLHFRGQCNLARPGPNDERVLIANWSSAIILDSLSGKIVKKIYVGNAIHQFCWSPNGSRIAAGCYDGTIRVCDVDAGRVPRQICVTPRRQDVLQHVRLCLVDGGKRIVAVELCQRELSVWDVDTGKLVKKWQSGLRRIRALVLAPDGRTLVVGGDNGLECWSTKTWEKAPPLVNMARHRVSEMRFSRDGRLLALVSDPGIHIVDLHSYKEQILDGHTGLISDMSFSPDGKRLVTGAYDKQVIVWDTETGRPMLTLKDHPDRVSGVTFTRDGARLISVSADGTVIIRAADPWE